MASIKKIQTVTGYELSLSVDEASTLMALFQATGGNPVESSRRHIDTMYNSLLHAGIAHDGLKHPTEGSVYFKIPKKAF